MAKRQRTAEKRPRENAASDIGSVVAASSEKTTADAPALSPDKTNGPAVLPFVAAIALVLLVACAYVPVYSAGFIWDDDDYVTKNKELRTSLGLRNIWFDTRATPQYYPLVHTTFWIEYQLWGLDARGYHVVNVLIHVGTALLLWRLLAAWRVPGSWWIAAVFALHPVHVESVAWVTERKNVLSGLFYMLAAHCYTRWAGWNKDESLPSPGPDNRVAATGWYALALVFFLAALLSKTVTVTLPAALLLIAWWKDAPRLARHAIAAIPFFTIGIPLAWQTARLERFQVGAQGEAFEYGLWERIYLAGRIPWFYAMKLLVPVDLSFIYPRWDIAKFETPWLAWTAATVALLIAFTVSVRWWGKAPLIAVLFFGGTLFPALGFLNVYPFKYSFVADHFQYLASIGIVGLWVGGVAYLVERDSRWKVAASVLGGAMLLTLSVLTFQQARVYHSRETLWSDVLEKNPTSSLALQGLAAERMHAEDYAKAEELYRQAIPLTIDVHDQQIVWHDLGQLLEKRGDSTAAKEAWKTAYELDRSQIRIGEILALIAMKEKDWPTAEQYLKAIIVHEPRHGPSRHNLAIALSSQRKHQEAEPHYRAAVSIEKNDDGIRLNWARCLASLGRGQEALEQARVAAQSRNRQIANEATDFLRQITRPR